VVDGDEAQLLRSQELLAAAGYQVSTADLPDIGLVRRIQPDALVLGLMYRGQASGLEFLERHAADPITARVPVIVHAAAEDLTADQWRRLTEVACPVEPSVKGSERLLAELQRVLLVRSAA
jgi:CheY-like chemotaxis protein